MTLKHLLSMMIGLFCIPAFAVGIDPTPVTTDQPVMVETTTTTTETSTVEDETALNKLNLNTATTKELKQIPGVTSNKARAIVKYRKLHGDFKSVEDLKAVNGFKRLSADKLKAIQDQLSVG